MPPTPHDPMRDDQSELDALDHAHAVLSASRTGLLHFGERTMDLKFVVANETGRIIASVPAAVLLATDHTLMVPEETDDALQLLLTPEEAAESDSTDRWLAYHGQPEHVRWVEFWIESARHGPWVFDGEAMMRPNTVAAAEPAVCKKLNADRAALARVCQRHAGVVVPTPTCVGVDAGGLYVRAAFGVVRVPFERHAQDTTDLTTLIDALVKSC